MSRASARRSFTLAVLLLGSMVVPAAPGMALEVAPPTAVLESLDGLDEAPAATDVDAPPTPDGADTPPAVEAPVAGDLTTSVPTTTPIPFTLVGFTLPEGVEDLEFRTEGPEGWSDWHRAEALEVDDGPDAGSSEAGPHLTRATDPYWVGEATAVQVRVDGASPEEVGVHIVDSMGLSESLFAKAARFLSARPAAAEASVGPSVVTRAEWGARAFRGTPRVITARYVVVHHTAGNNTYTAAQAPGVVRGIQAYHMDAPSLQWSDIGYNFLVDRFGTIYEGRQGSLASGIQGAHAAGHNSDSFGVSLMGNFDVVAPPAVAIDRMIDLIAWRFAVHGIDASPSATVTGAGTNNRTISTIVGHRDVGSTACPGRFVVSQMTQIRDRVSLRVAAASSAPVAVAGDWNGDGRATPGWFVGGRWFLRSPTGAVTSFTFGGPGDVPIVGDWNGNGRAGIGIVRNGRWHLRNTLSGGAAEYPAFTYGRVADGDVPLAGDWNGNGRDGIGIVRNGRWHLRDSLAGGTAEYPVFTYGRVKDGDIPFTGDWNGNGRDGIGIVRNGRWHLKHTLSGGTPDIPAFTFGRVSQGDLPVVGDWNRNGRAGIGIVRGTDWHLRNTLSGGNAEVSLTFGW